MYSTSELKRNARAVLRSNLGTALMATVLLFVISYVCSQLGAYASGYGAFLSAFNNRMQELTKNAVNNINGYPILNTEDIIELGQSVPDMLRELIRPLGVVLSLLLSAAESIISLGAAWFWLRLSRREPLKPAAVFHSLRSFTRILTLMLLMWIFTALWSLLFIIPGIIAVFRYSQAIYYAFDNPNATVLECLRSSKLLMKGRKGSLFLLFLSFIGWMFLSAFSAVILGFNLVDLFLIPYMGITEALFYDYAIKRSGPNPEIVVL